MKIMSANKIFSCYIATNFVYFSVSIRRCLNKELLSQLAALRAEHVAALEQANSRIQELTEALRALGGALPSSSSPAALSAPGGIVQ
jgi:hypothetical protein